VAQHACLILRSPGDPRDRSLLEDARALGLSALAGVEVEDLYFLASDNPTPLVDLLCDPVAQQARWRDNEPGPAVELALRPGVTDPVAEQLLRAAALKGLTLEGAATGLRFRLLGDLTSADIERFARLVANPVIHNWAVGAVEPHFLSDSGVNATVEVIPLRTLSAPELVRIAQERRTALDETEMLAVQRYYVDEGRDPTDAELEMIAQTWSEHCVHKTFKALIELEDGTTIDGLLKSYLKAATDRIAAPWVKSAFVDNAGILEFDEEFDVSFKVETHNHPSAIEPFGGANTGVGGVVRDVLGVSARPIAATDVLCFGPPDHVPPPNVIPPRLVRSGVVAGIGDYGNKIGIPTVSGAIVYHPGYTANPLVYCGCVGLAPSGSHPRDAQPGDRIVVLGGKDGPRRHSGRHLLLDDDGGRDRPGGRGFRADRQPHRGEGPHRRAPAGTRREALHGHHRLRRGRPLLGHRRDGRGARRPRGPARRSSQVRRPGALGGLAFRSPGADGVRGAFLVAAAPARAVRSLPGRDVVAGRVHGQRPDRGDAR